MLQDDIVETEESRASALVELKEMAGAKDVELLRTDDLYLLRFIRVAKYDLSKALKKLVKYQDYVTKQGYTKEEFSVGMRYWNVIAEGFLTLLADKRDSEGRMIGIFNPEQLDYTKFTIEEWTTCLYWVFESLLEMEHIQLKGVCFLMDCGQIGWKHFNLEAERSFAKLYGSMPIRMGSMLVYRSGIIVSSVWAIAKQFYSKKIQSRFHFLGSNVEDLYKFGVSEDCVPLEWGGQLDLDEAENYTTRFLDQESKTIEIECHMDEEMLPKLFVNGPYLIAWETCGAIQGGDRIVAINHEPISSSTFTTIIQAQSDKLHVKLLRPTRTCHGLPVIHEVSIIGQDVMQ